MIHPTRLKPLTTSCHHLLVIFIVLGIVPPALADRSVSIAVPDGVLELTNGSAATVTYSVECYDKVTGANLISGSSNVTLDSKKSVEHMSAGKCANGQTPGFKHNSGVMGCSGNGLFAAAASLCGPNSTLCTLPQLSSRGITSFNGFPNWLWLSSGQTSWYSTYDNWNKSSVWDETGGKSKNFAPRTYSESKGNSNHRCHTAAGPAGLGVGFCTSADTSFATGSGSLCCPQDNGFKSCKVTIHSATPATGYLQSPQFKGGAAF